jgi:hypothetical protein
MAGKGLCDATPYDHSLSIIAKINAMDVLMLQDQHQSARITLL